MAGSRANEQIALMGFVFINTNYFNRQTQNPLNCYIIILSQLYFIEYEEIFRSHN